MYSKTTRVIWADEFRTSILSTEGEKLVHPKETRPERLKPSECKLSPGHLPKDHDDRKNKIPGCRCLCSRPRCTKERKVRSFCEDHGANVTQYDLCFETNQLRNSHRIWHRDTVASINIGCLFLSQALRINSGPWSRTVKKEDVEAAARSWEDIFTSAGHRVPFKLRVPFKPRAKKHT